jgi:hypothetical protein
MIKYWNSLQRRKVYLCKEVWIIAKNAGFLVNLVLAQKSRHRK